MVRTVTLGEEDVTVLDLSLGFVTDTSKPSIVGVPACVVEGAKS